MRTKKAIYNIVTTIILEIVIVSYGLIIPRLIIENFGSNVNGLISSITQFLAYITLLESGIGPVVKSVLYKPIANKDKKTIASIIKTSEKFFRKIALIFLLYIAVLVIVYPLFINDSFNYFYIISLLIIISISTFAEYFFGITYKLYLQAEQKTYVISFFQIITYILSCAIIVFLIKMHFSIHFVKLLSGLVFVLRPILQNIYVKKKYNINFKSCHADYVFKNKWNGLAQHIAYVVHNNTDVFLLTLFCNLKYVSIYSVYNLVSSGIHKLIRSFSSGVSSSFGDMIAKKEQDNLKKKFNEYETGYYMVCSIIYSCTLILIISFVKLYTRGIEDANYVQPMFAYIFIVGAILNTIKQPYNDLANDAGYFKQMKKGAIIEAISNIIISLILVKKYNLIGVAIGTVVAMVIRLIHLIYITGENILHRRNNIVIKKFVLLIINIIIVFILFNVLIVLRSNNYLNWLTNGIIVFFVSSLINIITFIIFYLKDLKGILSNVSRVFAKRRN